MSMNKRFQDKVAIVTGAAGAGIGQATARMFAREGAKVVLSDLPAIASRIARISGEIKSSGAEVLGLECDVSKAEQVEAVVKQTLEQWGRIDILVNNAATMRLCELMHMTDELWNQCIDTCLKGTFYCCRAVLPDMVKQRYGRIINFSSGAVLQGVPQHAHYAAAKAGVIGLTRSLSSEVGQYNITVNCVCPIVIWNKSIAKMGYPAGYFERVREEIPMRRFGTPEEAAALVLFLASDDASYITGDTITIGGGRLSI
jgi:3-oxoacyl-[acyl-carrier protein] reductase